MTKKESSRKPCDWIDIYSHAAAKNFSKTKLKQIKD
eukprot:03870.XXX_39020_39127_1 [CDS] Oithona nana genome sequencing.